MVGQFWINNIHTHKHTHTYYIFPSGQIHNTHFQQQKQTNKKNSQRILNEQ
mgnify:CR=1 FL=1